MHSRHWVWAEDIVLMLILTIYLSS